MGQQVNVKCKMKNLSESNLFNREKYFIFDPKPDDLFMARFERTEQYNVAVLSDEL